MKLRIAGLIAGAVLLLPLAGEMYFRVCHLSVDGVPRFDRRNFNAKIHDRIYSAWSGLARQDPLLPPYLIYANQDIENPARLKEISERSRLPRNSTLTSYDILRGPEKSEKTKYTVHINSLGFRGREQNSEKPPGTFRIIVLGSDQTFGLGLPDEETYPYLLEKKLNDGRLKTKVEVWNGAQPGSTAIVGLAQLPQIFGYKPDLLILEYGLLENHVWGDDYIPRYFRFPNVGYSKFLRKCAGSFGPVASHSYLIGEVERYFSRSARTPGETKRVELFRRAMRKILSLAKDQHVAVALVQPFSSEVVNSPYGNLPQEFDSPVIDVESELQIKPIADGWNEEKAKEAWVNELQFPFSWKYEFDFRFYSYRLNPDQLNLAGNTVVAESASKMIEAKYLKELKP